MRKYSYWFVVLGMLFLAGIALAGDEFAVPTQAIEGAESPIRLGELVDLSVAPPTDKLDHYVSSTYAWKVLDYDARTGKWVEKKFRTYKEAGREGIFFGAGVEPRRLKVFCAVSHLYVVRDGDKIVRTASRASFLSVDVQVGDPEPPTPPTPPTPPAPNFPDGKYKLASLAYQQGMLVAAPRDAGARALARSYRDVARSDPADLKAFLLATKKSNDSALASVPGGVGPWEKWSDVLQDRLYELYSTKKLVTVADAKVAWDEIATGLEAVK
jgi:hypothetical protein